MTPMYEYECEYGHIFDKIVPNLDTDVECPECGSTECKRRFCISGNFHLKGFGWSETYNDLDRNGKEV